MSIGELLSVLFYFCGIISIMLGCYSLHIDTKGKLNRTFLALCVSLSVWAFGFSMAVNAADMSGCLFWRRISAFGWGSMYSILLHFSLILTKKDGLFKKWWTHMLIYTPAAITIYVFAISNSMALQQYNFVRTSFGWANISGNNGWDWFFNIYYISFMLTALGVIWKSDWNSYSASLKNKDNSIMLSFLIAFILGTVTDIIFNSVCSIDIPQIAPIIILLPIIVIYYTIIRYGLMNPKHVSEGEVILNESARAKVYAYISLTYVAGSFLTYFVQYLHYGDLLHPLYTSAFIFILGIVIYFLKVIKIGEYSKDILLVIIISITIPSITFIFIEFGSVTVWAFSFLFIVIALLFNKAVVLTSIAISTLSTQVLVWILNPEVRLVLDKADYLGRIGILCITMWLAFYVNKVYIKRLSQHAEQLSLQTFISEISSDFINVNQLNIDEKMNWVIRILGKLFSIDQINILLLDINQYTVEYSNIWGVKGESAGKNYKYNVKMDYVSWLIDQLISYESVYIPDVETLPEAVDDVKNEFKTRQIRSVVSIPIAEKEKTIRILEFAFVSATKKWQDEELRTLKIIANIFADGLRKVEVENEISYMAYHDHLTGLANRRLFRDRLSQAIALAKRTEKMVGVIFIDLDSFKTINDTLGHEGGDVLLKVISEKLSNSVRQSDTVSRFGADKFLVMINNLSYERDIISMIENMMLILNQPLVVDGQEFNLTTSAGIAMYPFDGTETDSLIKNADIALYKAKEKGKNQYVLCSSALKDEIMNKIKITNNLYRALEREEFYLTYQPQIDLTTGKIIGLEALIRWNHPELGFVSPAVFIPFAEQAGLISKIGEWVLSTACEQNKKWQTEGHPPICVAVNVSAKQLRNPDFVAQVKNILETSGLDPRYLEVEITESAAMSETNDIIKYLSDIRKLGVMISIDDFGTDYSSLSRLKELPIDKIKIDKQFIDSIEEREKDKAIVRTIINLAKNLDLKVIAEGVENENQLQFLKQELCDEVQGYYYYMPMTAQDIERIL
ncbi:EAL domain-containing protein [Lacrimispora sp.]|uniref:EAL domain-containing protein n=1 Tax=Lacrimispora sp. TaxID=2719234 RepID=UPI0034607B4A